MIEEIKRKKVMQMIIMAVKTLHPPPEKGRCRYVVPVIVCKQPVSNGK